MLWGGLELESRALILGETPLGSNHAEGALYNLLEFSTAYPRPVSAGPPTTGGDHLWAISWRAAGGLLQPPRGPGTASQAGRLAGRNRSSIGPHCPGGRPSHQETADEGPGRAESRPSAAPLPHGQALRDPD